MRKTMLGAALVVLSLNACTKSGENEYKVETPTIGTETKTVTTPDIDVGTRKDSISTPVVGTQKDTVIIDKPVVGTKKTEVNVPSVTVTKP